jgi:hypothetical protein
MTRFLFLTPTYKVMDVTVVYRAPGLNGGPGTLAFESEEQAWFVSFSMRTRRSELWENLMACLEMNEGGEILVQFGNISVHVEDGMTRIDAPNAWVSTFNENCVNAFRAMRADPEPLLQNNINNEP